MCAHVLSDKHPFRIPMRQLQHRFIHQPVIENHIRLLQPLDREEGQEIPAPRPRTHQRDMAFGRPLGRTPRSNGRLDRGRRHPRLDRWAKATGQSGKATEVLGQHLFKPRFDLAGEDRCGAFADDGDHHRIAVNNGRCGHIAKIRTVSATFTGQRIALANP